MRQTLIRVLFDDLWTMEFRNDVQFVGVGWLLVPWLLYGLWWALLRLRHHGQREAGVLQPILVWSGAAAFILTLPFWAGKLAPSGVPVYGYGFMLFVGFLVAGRNAARRADRVGINGELIWDAAVWVFVSGILGARLFYLVQYHNVVFAGKQGVGLIRTAINLPDGGLVLYGGVLMAIVAFLVFCRRKKLNALFMSDVIVPSIFIGLAFGRLGCFLNGCCYGDRCTLPWAVTFPKGSVPFIALVNRGFLDHEALISMPLHPTQIYSSLNALVLVFLTAGYFKYRHKDGAVLALALLVYPVTRFVIEYLRGDELGKFNTSLTISQWVSLGLFALGAAFLIWLTKRPDAAPAPRPARASS